MYDRDYYKEAWKKRDRGDIHGYHNGSSEQHNNFSTPAPLMIWPWAKVCLKYLYYVFCAVLALRLIIKVISGTYW